MIREIDFVSYLPPFMQIYKEPVEALRAEEPEFQIIWEAADRVLKNKFIATADEYGISRFERLLGIYPINEDTLESRRSRVQSKWFSKLPYTLHVLFQKLTALCGDTDFTLNHDFDTGYTLALETNLELYGQVQELEEMLNALLPCNIIFSVKNVISIQGAGKCYACGGVSFAQDIFITSHDRRENKWQNLDNL